MLRIAFLVALLAPASWAQLKGVIDLHVHCAPDSIARSIDALEIARIARGQGMRALLFKNHYTHTASLAYLVSRAVPGIESYGGIVLNASVGGINPAAVDQMTRTTGGRGLVVWMPTFDSEHYHRTQQPNANHVPVSRGGELLPGVKRMLALIAREGLALATGHSSPAESLMLLREARQAGIEKMIVTHPLMPQIGMTIPQQKEAASLGALLEYAFQVILPNGELTLADYVNAIRAIGPRHCVLTSDLGQALNPIHTDGLTAFFDQLRKEGFSDDEIALMAKRNPARLLGLE